MGIKELEDVMVSHGVALRAIPSKVVSIYEKYHIDTHPEGVIKYHEDFKREMLFVESIPKNAGKFIFESGLGTGNIVRYSGKKYFNSIEEAVDHLLNK